MTTDTAIHVQGLHKSYRDLRVAALSSPAPTTTRTTCVQAS
jgi:hypothetical protein